MELLKALTYNFLKASKYWLCCDFSLHYMQTFTHFYQDTVFTCLSKYSKFGEGKIMFLNEGYDHQGCVYLIKNTVKTVIWWNIITI